MKKYKKKVNELIKLKYQIEEEIVSDEEEKMDEVDFEEQKKFEENFKGKFAKMANQVNRASVSAEVYGDFNKKAKFSVKVIKKTDEQKKLIEEKVLKSFLFNSLEEKELKLVIDAMGEKKIK